MSRAALLCTLLGLSALFGTSGAKEDDNLFPAKVDLKKGVAALWDPADEGLSRCLRSLAVLLSAYEQQNDSWADTAMDSWYKAQTGVKEGALHWLGSYDECRNIRASEEWHNVSLDYIPSQNPISLQHDFDFKYCRTWYSYSRASGIIPSVGTCFPSTCSRKDVQQILNASTGFPITDTYCGEKPNLGSDGGAIFAIVILVAFGILVGVATIVDLVRRRKSKNHAARSSPVKKNDQTLVNQACEIQNTDPDTNKSDTSNHAANGTLGENESPQIECGIPANGETNMNNLEIEEQNSPVKDGKAISLLLSFSLCANLPRVLSTSQPQGTFTCMHGVRFLSMGWIVLGHSWQLGAYVFPGPMKDMIGVENYFGQFAYLREPLHLIINSMTLAVESFFLLSGCLVTVSFLKLLSKRNGKPGCRQMGLYYLHRYWRLTPVYAVVLMAYATLFVYVGDGPIFPGRMYDSDACRINWWGNLLYINAIPGTRGCMGWTWYLSDDFLYYLVVPVFAIALYRIPKLGIGLVIGSICGVTIIRIILFMFFDISNSFLWLVFIYFPPYSRFGSYAIGIGLGYLLHRTKCKLKIRRALFIVGCISAGLLCTFAYADICSGELCPWGLTVFYRAVQRSVFALSVAWFVLICCCGYGGCVNSFLSWKFFIPLSRLTYISYLIHPIVIYLYTYTRRRMIYVDNFTMTILFIGYLNLTLLGSFVLTLVFEIPFLNLEKVILRKKDK